MRRFYSREGVGFSKIILFLALLIAPVSSSAEEKNLTQPQKYESVKEERGSLRFTPLNLRGGSKLTVISPASWTDIAEELLETISKTHTHYNALFGEIPALSARIRLMDEEEFFSYTRAPAWTNAMYYKGEVLIPLATNQPIDLENLHRSVKHEYTHAVISSLSAGKAPGWLDEGLAQWSEGPENPHLKRVLKSWLKTHGPVELRLLQGGFTRLDQEMVPAAYAQSLFAAHAVLNTYGLEKMSNYFRMLREGSSKSLAFERGFGISEESFELELATMLGSWSVSPDKTSLKIVHK